MHIGTMRPECRRRNDTWHVFIDGLRSYRNAVLEYVKKKEGDQDVNTKGKKSITVQQ